MLAAVLAHLALMPTAGCISMSADVYPVATVRSPCFFPIVFHDLDPIFSKVHASKQAEGFCSG